MLNQTKSAKIIFEHNVKKLDFGKSHHVESDKKCKDNFIPILCCNYRGT